MCEPAWQEPGEVLQQAGGEGGTWLSCDLNTCAHCEPETAAPVSPQPGAGFSQPGLQLSSQRPRGSWRESKGKPSPRPARPREAPAELSQETFPLCPRGAVWAGRFPQPAGALHSVLFPSGFGLGLPPEAMSAKPPLPELSSL